MLHLLLGENCDFTKCGFVSYYFSSKLKITGNYYKTIFSTPLDFQINLLCKLALKRNVLLAKEISEIIKNEE